MGRMRNLVHSFNEVVKREGFGKAVKKSFARVKRAYKNGGIQNVTAKVEKYAATIDIPKFYQFVSDDTQIPLNEEEKKQVLAEGKIILNWIIPELDVGSGGHIDIFRFVNNLENKGFHSRLYLYGTNKFPTDKELNEFVGKYYKLDLTRVELYCDTSKIKFAQATFATGWQTAYFVRRFHNTISKFYFVQDFEPMFSPISSEYLLAENTYNFGFRGITAGDWLKKKLHDEYGMQTDSFYFSYDREIYKPVQKRDNLTRIFLYARPVTPRRCFELALLAIIRLKQKMPNLEIVMAGWDVSNYVIPFPFLNAGNLRLEELPDLYGQCDLCIVMSSTNLSLLPVEIMASNSVCACTRGPHNEWMLNEDNCVLLPIDPNEMADTLYDALNDKERLARLRKNGLEFAQTFTSWEKEADKVYSYILKGIEEDAAKDRQQ